MLGLFLCAYGSFIALRPTVPCFKSNPLAGRILAGALRGITGGLAAFPGAFVVFWSHVQGFEQLRQRSIVQPYILNRAVGVVTPFYLRPVATTYLDAVQYAAPAVLGAYFGMNIFRKLGPEGFNRMAGYSLAFAGLLMATKAI
jgi:uncharacterized membrane protein YfcA